MKRNKEKPKLKYRNLNNKAYLSEDYSSENIYGFMHIAAVNDYKKIVLNQVEKIVKSGLYDDCTEINMGVVGYSGKEKDIFEFELPEKFKIVYVSANIKEYEFPTLNLLHKKSLEAHKDSLMWYIHTKGVFNRRDYWCIKQIEWRNIMENLVLERYKEAINIIRNNGYCTCGCFLNIKNREFSGNFWWAKSDYIKKLPEIDCLNKNDRFLAERWIGSGSYGKEKCMFGF